MSGLGGKEDKWETSARWYRAHHLRPPKPSRPSQAVLCLTMHPSGNRASTAAAGDFDAFPYPRRSPATTQLFDRSTGLNLRPRRPHTRPYGRRVSLVLRIRCKVTIMASACPQPLRWPDAPIRLLTWCRLETRDGLLNNNYTACANSKHTKAGDGHP